MSNLKLSDLLLDETLESEDWEAESGIIELNDSEFSSDEWELPSCGLSSDDSSFAGCESCQ